LARAGDGHGQPLGPQRREGQGAYRGAGLGANVPATLLAQPQPHSASVLEIKGLLRKAEARTREALVETMGRAISAIPPRDAEVYFLEHHDYRLVAQQLYDRRSRMLCLRSRACNQ
jgi:hypothetical protein